MPENIHPIFNQMISRSQKEDRLNQKGHVFWLTGLSGSGKSTLAIAAESELFLKGFKVQLLDGDNIRMGISSNLRFTAEDRAENIRRIAEVAHLFKEAGFVVICSFITPSETNRTLAKKIIGEDDLSIIYIKADLQTCEERDVKGLYKKARSGEIKNFTGIDAPFDIPYKPSLEVNTHSMTLQESLDEFLKFAIPRIQL